MSNMDVTTDIPRRNRRNARDVIAGRLLTVVGDQRDIFDALDPEWGGIVLTGQKGLSAARTLGNRNPDAVILIEPSTFTTTVATVDAPFLTPVDESNTLLDVTLDSYLDQQVTIADAAILPGGHLEAGRRDVLDAIIEHANGVDRSDVILLIIADPRWLIGSDLKKLIHQVGRSVYPVAIGFTSTENPLPTLEHHRGYRELFAATGAFAWRADYAGLDAYAYGALGTAIGVIPSLRKATAPGEQNKARNPKDKRPHMAYRELMRFVRTSQLETWLVNHPVDCPCLACEGRPLDRLGATKADKLISARHNSLRIRSEFDRLRLASNRVAMWRQMREDAVAAHLTLGFEINRKIHLEPSLNHWRALDSDLTDEPAPASEKVPL